MIIVPHQPEADSEVIAYFSKQPRLTCQEMAALAAGINPISLDVPFGESAPAYAEERRSAMNDFLRIIQKRIDSTLRVSKPAAEWKSIFAKNNLPFPPHLSSPVPDQGEKQMQTRERNILHTMIAVLTIEAKIDISRPSKAAQAIVHCAEEAGHKLAVSTVEGYLKEIAKLLERQPK